MNTAFLVGFGLLVLATFASLLAVLVARSRQNGNRRT